jgi:hypothetical protein
MIRRKNPRVICRPAALGAFFSRERSALLAPPDYNIPFILPSWGAAVLRPCHEHFFCGLALHARARYLPGIRSSYLMKENL